MWRLLALIVVIAVIGGAWQKYGGLGKFSLRAPQPVYEGYWEMRMKIQVESRDFELVALGDRPLVKECEAGASLIEMPKFCTPENHCKMLPLSCEHEIAPRYQRMLDQQPANLHYLHYAGDTPEGHRRAIVVGWGMSEPESAQVCEAMRKARMPTDAPIKVSCI